MNWKTPMPNDTDDDPGPLAQVTPNEDIGVKGAPSGLETDEPSSLTGKADVQREPGDVPPERKTLVQRKIKDCKQAKKFWDEDFKRMKEDEDMLLGLQWQDQKKLDDDRYVVNVVQRHIQQRTAAIYAKNPTVVARSKPMMDFTIWDENPMSYQMATQTVAIASQTAQAAAMGDPQADAKMQMSMQSADAMKAVQMAQTLLQDIQQGMQRRAMKDRVCKTMELYFKNKVLAQQNPPFKANMKQLVRRTLAAGVGYLKLGLVREMQPKPMSPDELKGMATAQERMAQIEMMMADMVDDDAVMADASAEKEELRLMIEAMRTRPSEIVQEGLVFDFPSAIAIIPDWRLTHLQGFTGCEFVCEEYMLTTDEIQKVWKVDVCGNCTIYDPDNPDLKATDGTSYGRGSDGRYKKGLACVWVQYDRTTGLVYVVCDGYPDFLEEPSSPPIILERFYPWYPLAFNYIEHHKQRFPLSDAFLLRDQQKEMNRCREGLRQHRIANRPLTAVSNGVLDDGDKQKLETRPANAVVQLNAMAPGTKIDDVLQIVKHPGINPELYDVSPLFEDILRTVGTQEANLGGTSGSTATESSIAESSRMSSLQSNLDDMDDFLTEVMKDAGKVALMEIGAEEVGKIVGIGAAWPQLTNQDVADEIFLEIVAGSSGRPNKAQEVQNFTQAAPFLLQIPGLSPEWLGKQLLSRMDDRMDLSDAFMAGQPSIQALNAMAAKPLTSQPTDANAQMPESQGANGGQNTPVAPGPGSAVGPQGQNRMPPQAAPVQH
jgi:hypothetical protein